MGFPSIVTYAGTLVTPRELLRLPGIVLWIGPTATSLRRKRCESSRVLVPVPRSSVVGG